MIDEERNLLIGAHYRELSAKYVDLSISQGNAGTWIISGLLRFSASVPDKEVIDDEYKIKITLLPDYPNTSPTAEETGGRIPEDFHRNKQGGTLCLAAPLDAHIKFAECPTLVGFVENLLIPYLYSFSYIEKYGNMPFGELSHGGEGLLEYYRELFNVSDDSYVMGLLRILSDDDYRGHHDCPCESGKIVRQCHGSQLLYIAKHQTRVEFSRDYLHIINYILENKENITQNRILQKHLIKPFRKKLFTRKANLSSAKVGMSK